MKKKFRFNFKNPMHIFAALILFVGFNLLIFYFTNRFTKDLIFISIAVVAIAMYMYFRMWQENYLKYFISDLTADDFTFTAYSLKTTINIADISVGKVKTMDGDTAYKLIFPCVQPKSEYENYIRIGGFDKTEIEVGEEEYRRYSDSIAGYDVIEFESYILTAEMNHRKRYRFITYLSELEFLSYKKLSRNNEILNHFISQIKSMKRCADFIAERHNIPNIITDVKPFSSEDYGDFVDKIKEQMREHL